jgi:hypothetical protein
MMRLIEVAKASTYLYRVSPGKSKEHLDMPRKFPPDVVEQAQDVVVGWGQVTPAVTFGTLTVVALQADITAAAPIEADIARLKKQLADKCNQRDILYAAIWDKTKRVRSGFKCTFGDDSQQYEWVGGTRMSDRKVRTRKASTTTTTE